MGNEEVYSGSSNWDTSVDKRLRELEQFQASMSQSFTVRDQVLTESKGRIRELEERIRRLDTQTQFETDEDDASIKALRVRVLELESRLAKGDENEPLEVWSDRQLSKLAGAIRELRASVFTDTDENRVTSAHNRITAETQRINELRRQIGILSEMENEWMSKTNDRLEALEGHPKKPFYAPNPGFPLDSFVPAQGQPTLRDTYELKLKSDDQLFTSEDEFSPAIGGLRQVEEVQLPESDRFVTGFAAGRQHGVKAAARAVRNFMDFHWSKATVDQVVEVINELLKDELPVVADPDHLEKARQSSLELAESRIRKVLADNGFDADKGPVGKVVVDALWAR